MQLYFDLLDGTYTSMYVLFCRDIINACEKAGPNNAFLAAIQHWKHWKELFGNRKKDLLDPNAIKGLIGEMIELRDHFFTDYGDKIAVSAWLGPLLGHKDFEIDDTWYEVKSVNENAVQVTINSLEQLDSEQEGHLVVVRLEATSSVSALAVNLNKIVADISGRISDSETYELFIARLENMGYICDPEYDNYNFMYKGTERYTVTADFPCLKRSAVNSSITGVKYSILLNGISAYRER